MGCRELDVDVDFDGDADKVAGISKVDAETTIARTEQEKIAEIKEAEDNFEAVK